MFVEIHIIQNFAPSCLNRDESNSPKDCMFGGYRRARISSQCLKRSMRDQVFSNNLTAENGGVRTLKGIKILRDALVKEGKSKEDAFQVAKNFQG